MTAHKHLKELIRARMEKTGERYASARRQVLASTRNGPEDSAPATYHFPGNIAATTALRNLLANAGVRAPHTGEPFTEAMLFGIAGGIGIGVFSFYYEKADFASFFISGRHKWHDDLDYLSSALAAFGIEPTVREAGGRKSAAKDLRDALEVCRPSIAWVDMGSLPHRGMPERYRGSGYHVVTVYEMNEAEGTALIGDLMDHPIAIPLDDLEAARERIKKQRFRVLSIDPGAARAVKDLRTLVEEGLRRCHGWFLNPTLPQSQSNATLDALRIWANRLLGSKDSRGWERIFRPEGSLWAGLGFVYTFIESYGTGGGLSRPLFADFLEEASAAVQWPELGRLAGRYRELGRQWSELAEAALPEDIPHCRRARALRERLAELGHEGGPAEEAREAWRQLAELDREAQAGNALSDARYHALLAGMQARVLGLYEGESAALGELARLVA